MTNTPSKLAITILKAGLLSTGFYLSITTTMANSASDNKLVHNLTCNRIIDHTVSTASTRTPEAKRWYSINDNVMGGRSRGSFTKHEDHLRFHGSINTNGGGFASIRHDVEAKQFQGADHIRLAIQSDGRAYNLTLQDETSWRQSSSHRAPITTSVNDSYQIIEVLFKDLIATFRGRRIQTAPFDPAAARTIGIILSDSADGPFELKLWWIEVCRRN